MLDGLRQFIADVVSPHAHEIAASRHRLSTGGHGAFLLHVISLNGEPSEGREAQLHSLIESRFGLDPAAPTV